MVKKIKQKKQKKHCSHDAHKQGTHSFTLYHIHCIIEKNNFNNNKTMVKKIKQKKNIVLMTPINKEHTHLPYITYIVLLKKNNNNVKEIKQKKQNKLKKTHCSHDAHKQGTHSFTLYHIH